MKIPVRIEILFFWICFLFIVLFTPEYAVGQKQPNQSYKEIKESQTFRIVFYNTENLYDIDDDSMTNDNEFTPGGNMHWNLSRYNNKLQKIAKVLIAIGGWEGIDLAGLCEIENRKVLEDLLQSTPLAGLDYGIIHRESYDPRGSDVALLYRKKSFTPVFYDFMTPVFAEDSNSRTRDILYAKGLVKNADTLHIFVNHWPSRRGGKELSETRRIQVARLLKSKVDSVLNVNMNSKIVIVGDLNDEPIDKSVNFALGAIGDSSSVSDHTLYNFMYNYKMKGEGSYKYLYEWNMLDQIMGSASLFNKQQKLFANFKDAHIFMADWMLEDDPKFPGKKPLRTYSGPRYLGGYSDHLPVYLDLHIRK
jgi:predicted extracellular nuclease